MYNKVIYMNYVVNQMPKRDLKMFSNSLNLRQKVTKEIYDNEL